jgi:hypothetical protein
MHGRGKLTVETRNTLLDDKSSIRTEAYHQAGDGDRDQELRSVCPLVLKDHVFEWQGPGTEEPTIGQRLEGLT